MAASFTSAMLTNLEKTMRKSVIAIALALMGMMNVAIASEVAAAASQYDKPGFVTVVEKGRLWVFKDGSKELEDFRKHGEPTVANVKIGAGPEGMTIKGPSMEVIEAYIAQ